MKKFLEYILNINIGHKKVRDYLYRSDSSEKIPMLSLFLMFLFISIISIVLRFFVNSFAPAAKEAIKKIEETKISQINKYNGKYFEFDYPAKFSLEELKAGVYPAGTLKITDPSQPNEEIKIIINQNIAKNSDFTLIKKVYAADNIVNVEIENSNGNESVFNNITNLEGFKLKMQFSDNVKGYRYGSSIDLNSKEWVSIDNVDVSIPWPYEYNNGVYSFNIQANYKDDSVSDVIKTLFIIDREAPKIKKLTQKSLVGPSQLQIELSIEVLDNFFNKENLYYKIATINNFNDLEWIPLTNNINYTLDSIESNKVFLQLRDEVGNVSEVYDVDIEKDLIAPKFYAEVSDYSDDLFRKIDIYGFDDLSNIERIIISNKQDFSEQESLLFASSILWNFDENRTAYIKLIDNFGNVTEPRIINAPTLKDLDQKDETKNIDTAKKLEIDQIIELNNQTQNFNEFIDDLTLVDNFQRKYLLNSRITDYDYLKSGVYEVNLAKDSEKEINRLSVIEKDSYNIFILFTEHDNTKISDLEHLYLKLVEYISTK